MKSEYAPTQAALISPESIGPPPRKVVLTGNGATIAAVTAALFAAALICAGSVISEAAHQDQIRNALRTNHSETVGTIQNLRNPFHELKEYVDYTIIVNGQTYTGEAIVPLEDYHSIRSTGSLSIRYLPDNPAVNHPSDWDWSAISEFDPFFELIILLGFGCILFIPPQMQFQRRLAAYGIAVIGTVTKCTVSARGGFITLKYDFRIHDGSLLQGRGSFQAQQEIGAKVLILYLSQNPRKNTPYPISAWRIANR